MSLRLTLASALALTLVVCPAHAQESASQKPAPSSDLDVFMERVLARRDVNRKVMNDYILDEREAFEILGPGRFRLHRTSREYTWFVRDGIHVRSPVRFEGVSVPEDARIKYEENWLQREKRRRERKAKGEKETKQITLSESGISTNVVPTEPRFVSEAFFMDFKFEPGNYYFAGREQFEGQEVVKIEYYPTRMFADDDAPEERRRDRGQKEEDELSRKMNKTALVTLWVDPKEHQIVKYTFDNVWLDFLPGAWLVRIDAMRASMTMFQPFAGVWLPRGIDISAGVTLANGSFEASYDRRFSEYREADVKTKIRIPKTASPETGTLNISPEEDSEECGLVGPEMGTGSSSFSVAPETLSVTVSEIGPVSLVPQEKVSVTVSEIRIHGNAAIPDAEVLRIAGVSVGGPLAPDAVDAIEKRLKDSGRFETVQVRLRYRSLTDPTDVALVLVVHEKPGVVVNTTGQIERPISRRIFSRVMFLPIVSYADGYGFTYGARFSTVGLLGAGERLSVPLTWGGTRRAALEFERTFDRGPFTRILASTAIWQRENPRHDIDDRRVELKGRVERHFAQILYAGAEGTRQSVDFGSLDDRLWTFGADAGLDTRGNPAFPANALYVNAGWTALNVREGGASALSPGTNPQRINRYTVDGRGYLRLIRQSVLAARARYSTADARLPVYERWLIGGSDTLRGFRAGAFEGDKALVTSAELRMPITSIVSGAKLGVNIFLDAARTAAYGSKLGDAEWQRGAGAGVFMIAAVIRLNLDVARSLDGGGTRVHFSSGFSF